MSQQNVIDVAMRIHAQVDGAQQAVNSLKQAFGSLKLSDSLTKSFESDFKNIEKLAEKYKSFQTLASSGKLSNSDMNEMVKTSQEYERALDRLIERWKSLTSQDLKGTLGNDTDLKKKQDDIKNFETLLSSKFQPALKATAEAMDALNKGNKNSLDFKNLNLTSRELKQDFEAINNALTKNQDIQAAGNLLSSVLAKAAQESQRLQTELDKNNQRIAELTRAKEELEKKTEDNEPTMAAYKKAVENYKGINTENTLKNFQNLTGTINQNYQEFSNVANNYNTALSSLQSKVASYQTKFADLIPKQAQEQANNFFAKLNTPLQFGNLTNFKTEVKQVIEAMKAAGADSGAIKSFANTFSQAFYNKNLNTKEITEYLNTLSGAGAKISAIQGDFDECSGVISKLTTTIAFNDAQWKNLENDFNSISSAFSQNHIGDALTRYQQALKSGDHAGANSIITGLYQELQTAGAKIEPLIANIKARIDELQAQLDSNSGDKNQISAWAAEINKLQKAVSTLEGTKAKIDGFTGNLSKIDVELNKLRGDKDLQPLVQNIENLKQSLNQEQSDKLAEIVKNINDLVGGAERAGDGLNRFNDGLNNTVGNTQKVNSEIQQVVNRFARFTTLAGIMDIFRRSIRAAFEAVKELDEAMNSIAVVTDMTTQDLWDQVDAYTAMANETGSTIAGAYQVAQLYYQQGLSTNDVMTATTETLKLARVAGIEYAEATDYKPQGYVA